MQTDEPGPNEGGDTPDFALRRAHQSFRPAAPKVILKEKSDAGLEPPATDKTSGSCNGTR